LDDNVNNFIIFKPRIDIIRTDLTYPAIAVKRAAIAVKRAACAIFL
jgi:hypothetical protein